MLTGMKVASLTCRYAFYRPELNTKAGPHGLNALSLEMKHTNG